MTVNVHDSIPSVKLHGGCSLSSVGSRLGDATASGCTAAVLTVTNPAFLDVHSRGQLKGTRN